MTVVSIIIPIFNEEKTLRESIDAALSLSHERAQFQIIIVDDGSTDSSRDLIKKYESHERVIVVYHERNKGKGAALRTGFNASTGSIITIFDADLEYDALELLTIIEPLLDNRADIVYGSRMVNKQNPIGYWYMYAGNKFISAVAKLLYGKSITDVETCYKAFSKKFLKKIDLTANGFGFEAEFTAQVLKSDARLLEVPISYKPRGYQHGKKISWKDGVEAVWILLKFKFRR